MTIGIRNILPAPPPFVPLPRFLVEGLAGYESNPLNPEELGELEGKYGKWAARTADAFAVDFGSAKEIARGLSERIKKAF